MSQQVILSMVTEEGHFTMTAEEGVVVFEMVCGGVCKKIVFQEVEQETEVSLYDESGNLIHSYTASGSARDVAIQEIDSFLGAGKEALFT